MTAINEKIAILKLSQQEYEWYPTTDEMIKAICKNCNDPAGSVLDIGAGDGRVLLGFDKFQKNGKIDKYAIEKSEIHINNMPPDISIVGTDFLAQTLIDKKVDIVFCNPPYSQYEEWATKIIKEANSEYIFLILPERWQNSALIKQAMKTRKINHQIIWKGDFLEADRTSRAKVEIIKLIIGRRHGYYEEDMAKEPFDVWFEEYFTGFEQLNHLKEEEEEKLKYYERQRVDIGELVEGQNLIERLCNLYNNELNALLQNYIVLSKLDLDLLKELGVEVSEIKKGLKSKIEGLKNKYWKELFDRFEPITKKLISSSRNKILEKLHASCNVDFSVENAYAIALWTIKNANKYINSQVIEIFKELSEPDCVKNYKSNIKTWEKDRWRYKHESKHTHYILDYRIVAQRYCAICHGDSSWQKYDYPNNLSNRSHDFINDILTIANNLGFFNGCNSKSHYWDAGVAEEMYQTNNEILFSVRAYKNGNLHFKFNQQFIKAFNIEASRLLGWIKTPEEASAEMDIDLAFAKEKFGSNLLLGLGESRKLLCA